MAQNPAGEAARLDAAANDIVRLRDGMVGVGADLAVVASLMEQLYGRPNRIANQVKNIAANLTPTLPAVDQNLLPELQDIATSIRNNENARRRTEGRLRQTIADYQTELAARDATIRRRDSTVYNLRNSNQQLQQEIDNLRRNPPQPVPINPRPPTPDSPNGNDQASSVPLNRDSIKDWLKAMRINGECPLQDAILRGNADIVRRADSSKLHLAMHVAAISGNVQIASILVDKRVSVNKTCETLSSNGATNRYVTPLHFAIGAQRHEMIRFLINQRASLSIPTTVDTASAPPRFLISERWITWMRNTGSEGLIDTIDTLKSAGWDVNASLTKRGETMLELTSKLRDRFSGTRSAVISALRRRGAS